MLRRYAFGREISGEGIFERRKAITLCGLFAEPNRFGSNPKWPEHPGDASRGHHSAPVECWPRAVTHRVESSRESLALQPIGFFHSEHDPNVGQEERPHRVRLSGYGRRQLKRGSTRLFW